MAMTKNGSLARVVLEDGAVLHGRSFGHEQSAAGEVVFNTAMTGYPESLTDPSYRGQILVLTYPLIGNYGAPPEDKENGLLKYYESDRIHIAGLIVSDYSFRYSHWNAQNSLGQWLKGHNIPAVYGIDTRALTKRLREKGTMLGKIIFGDKDVDFHDPNRENLVDQVSIRERTVYGTGKYRVILIDCGVKYNILRHLLMKDTTVIRVPWDYDYSQESYDGIFISNGPGDPKRCSKAIENIARSLKDSRPVFGICLGNQLMALAAGADTYKLKYGHRSHNQPVKLVNTHKAYITSQNHSFAVNNDTLPSDWEPLFINVNDGTNEGMKHKKMPFFSAQFHPEASGGPTDTAFLLDDFIGNIKAWKGEKG